MSNCDYPLNRFNKPSKQLLVEMINAFNGASLKADQLIFGTPVPVQDDGKTNITVKFQTNTGWSLDSRIITYYRIEATRHEQLSRLVLHAESLPDTPALLDAIFQQTGVLLEPELIEVQEIFGGLDADQSDITNRVKQPFLQGFDEVPAVPFVHDPDLDRNFKISFKPDHLIFFGSIVVIVRPAINLLGNNIARRMDFRDFYKDGVFGRPPVDLYIPQGVLLVGPQHSTVIGDSKQTQAYLYEQKAGPIVAIDSQLHDILDRLTSDLWRYVPDATVDFNIYNSTILYNGLVSPEYSADDPRYSYVMVIQLGDKCRNLSGVLRIGYRYSSPAVPANHQINAASATPLFQH
jgi:hypothetical protein